MNLSRSDKFACLKPILSLDLEHLTFHSFSFPIQNLQDLTSLFQILYQCFNEQLKLQVMSFQLLQANLC